MAGKRVRRPSRRAIDAAGSDSEDERSRAHRKRRTGPRPSQSSSPGRADSESVQEPAPVLTKREKFDVRYKTSTRSDAEVLGAMFQ
jgi:hypothetical protein